MEFLSSYLMSFGLMALLSIAFGFYLRSAVDRTVLQIGIGLLFGGCAALSMYNPVSIASGVFVDPRNLFVGIAAAFLGPVAGIASLLVAAAVRLSIGGVGAAAGLLSMTIAAGAGVVWAMLFRDRVRRRVQYLAALGAMISTSLFAVILLPREAGLDLIAGAGIYIIFFNVVGAVLFGSLFERERQNSFTLGRLNEQAVTDPLTGLLNRRGFFEKIETLAASRGASAAAVLVVDLDHFKSINDRYGHDAGDGVLVAVARVLRESLRKKSIVARFGGEEFVVLLPGTDLWEARKVAERIRVNVEALGNSPDGPVCSVTTSVGGVWGHADMDIIGGLRKADRALYRAKEQGRNRVEFFAEADEASA